MAVSDFGAPIPGNSLFTHAPGERPWERPSKLNTVEEAVSFYVTSLAKEDIMDDLMVAMEAGVPIYPIAKALTTSQVMRGTHTLDVALLVRPVIIELLAAVAESNDIDFKFSNRNIKKEMDEKERARIQMILNSAVAKAEEEGTKDAGTDLLGEIAEFLGQDSGADKEAQEDETPEDMPPPEAEELEQVNAPPMEGAEPEELDTQEQVPQEMGLMSRR
jgi:hypothetical protein